MPSLALPAVMTFALVLSRIAGLVLIAPLTGARHLPIHFRALLTVALALVIAPIEWSSKVVLPNNWAAIALGLSGEFLIGAILGFGVAILLAGLQISGQIVSQMGGLAAVEVLDPMADSSEPLVAQLWYMVGLAVFVTIGGHRMMVAALLDTYRVLPLGQLDVPQSLGELTVTFLTESFSLALRAAAPAMIALLLATTVLGLISRTIPQLNILTIGFGLNALVAVAVLSISVGAAALLFEDQFEPALQSIVDALRSTAH